MQKHGHRIKTHAIQRDRDNGSFQILIGVSWAVICEAHTNSMLALTKSPNCIFSLRAPRMHAVCHYFFRQWAATGIFLHPRPDNSHFPWKSYVVLLKPFTRKSNKNHCRRRQWKLLLGTAHKININGARFITYILIGSWNIAQLSARGLDYELSVIVTLCSAIRSACEGIDISLYGACRSQLLKVMTWTNINMKMYKLSAGIFPISVAHSRIIIKWNASDLVVCCDKKMKAHFPVWLILDAWI